MTRAGFPHSDILGSRFVCQLPEAYRRLQRPSSAPSAKASTLCPYKLDHKDHSKKMLASTVQFSSYDRNKHPHPSAYPHPERFAPVAWAVRPSGTSPQPPAPTPHPQVRTACAATLMKQPSGCSLRTQQRAQPTPPQQPSVPTQNPEGPGVLGRHQLESRPTVDVPPSSTVPHSFGRDNGPGHPPATHDRRRGCQMLLRKEVIQPHLPVRLPCYDLVPIASPTFDSSLHKGWATGFGCYRLS